MGYGPKLTDKQKAKLEDEIRNFDKKKTLINIEKNALGGKDLNAYSDWLEDNCGVEPLSANPDSIQEYESLEPTGSIDWELLNAKIEINEILSFRQKQVWQLCMRQGKSVEEASEQLNLKIGTVSDYLKTAKEKVKRHFND